MGRKNKGNSSSQRPNAPDFQILQQPPHNPYYPDPSAAASLLASPPPPPYSDITVPSSNPVSHSHYPNAVPMAQINTNSSPIRYPRFDSGDAGHVPIVIQASSSRGAYDRRADRYNRRVRSFNNQTLLISILAIILSIWAFNSYENRKCLFDFTVHKPAENVTITLSQVRDSHLMVAFMSAIIVITCILKSACGYNSKSYSCYLFIMGLCSFFITLYTGYLAYLAFYSPCVLTLRNIGTNIGKTFIGGLIDHLPAPDRGVLGEQNVLALASEDRGGVMVFIFDLINFVTYLSVFLSSITIC